MDLTWYIIYSYKKYMIIKWVGGSKIIKCMSRPPGATIIILVYDRNTPLSHLPYISFMHSLIIY